MHEGMFLGCSPVFYFYPHFIKRNSGQETGCHAPVLCTPGDGRKFPLGTGLLNIAGEKIEGSGILGHSLFVLRSWAEKRMIFFHGIDGKRAGFYN